MVKVSGCLARSSAPCKNALAEEGEASTMPRNDGLGFCLSNSNENGMRRSLRLCLLKISSGPHSRRLVLSGESNPRRSRRGSAQTLLVWKQRAMSGPTIQDRSEQSVNNLLPNTSENRVPRMRQTTKEPTR